MGANLNKVMLIGRLTRDPEIRVFANGGKVASFGFAVNNRKKNPSTGLWEEEPCFLDLEAFNSEQGNRKKADIVEQYLRKGSLAYIEGHLKLDQWTDKEGQKRSKLKIVVDEFQFLEPKGDGAPRAPSSSGMRRPLGAGSMDGPPMDEGSFESVPPEPALQPPPMGRPEEDIPF